MINMWTKYNLHSLYGNGVTDLIMIVNATGKAIPMSRLQQHSSRSRETIKKKPTFYAKVDSNSM